MNQYTLFVLLTFFVSCSPFASYVGIKNNPSSIQTLIEPGDKVKIITKDDEEISFVVVEVTDDAILGESDRVQFTNVGKLQKETVSGTANFWWNNYTVGEDWWMDGWCDSFEYNPEQKEWVCSD